MKNYLRPGQRKEETPHGDCLAVVGHRIYLSGGAVSGGLALRQIATHRQHRNKEGLSQSPPMDLSDGGICQ